MFTAASPNLLGALYTLQIILTLKQILCKKNECSKPHDVPLQHVYNLELACTLSYHVFKHPQHMEVADTRNTNFQEISKTSFEFTNREIQ